MSMLATACLLTYSLTFLAYLNRSIPLEFCLDIDCNFIVVVCIHMRVCICALYLMKYAPYIHIFSEYSISVCTYLYYTYMYVCIYIYTISVYTYSMCTHTQK